MRVAGTSGLPISAKALAGEQKIKATAKATEAWTQFDACRMWFVILRATRSPRAAPHPASRRGSCLRLLAYDFTSRGLPPHRQSDTTDVLGATRGSPLPMTGLAQPMPATKRSLQ